MAAISQRPSGVGAVPYAVAGSSTHWATLLVAVSMTASCGLVWSAVKTQRSSFEMAMRCVVFEIGIMAITFLASRSSTETVIAIIPISKTTQRIAISND